MSSVAWVDAIGAASLDNAKVFPGSRFANWNPADKPFGERAASLGTGVRTMVAFRDDLTVALDIQHVPNTEMAKMLRLQYHLRSGGSVDLTLSDPSIPSMGTCKLAPGAEVQIQLTDPTTLEYTLSTVLRSGSVQLSPDGSPLSEFILWLQADKPYWPSLSQPANGTLLAQQNDTSGNGNHGVAQSAGNHPRFDVNIQNGLPGIYFKGSDYSLPPYGTTDQLVFPGGALVDLPEGEAFIVLKLATDPPAVVDTPGLGGLWQMHRGPDSFGRTTYRSSNSSSFIVAVAFGSPPIDLGLVSLDLSQAHVFNAVASSTEKTFRFNSVLRYTGASPGVGFPDDPGADDDAACIGADADRGYALRGWILEFVFVSPVRTSAQRAAWHSYLANKWGFALMTKLPLYVETVVVAGGGSGGHVSMLGNSYGAGGGGAGGCLHKIAHVIEPGSYPIVVGQGGAGGFSDNSGTDSSFDTILTKGGGWGCSPIVLDDQAGGNGGSGGGAVRDGPAGAVLQGNRGGRLPAYEHAYGIYSGNPGSGNGHYEMRGGGGGGWAARGNENDIAGHGGSGRAKTISGASVFYGAGGAGGGYTGFAAPAGGDGGGGTGGGERTDGQDGTGIGSGGGGGGSSAAGAATAGGSGTAGQVVVRRKTSEWGTCTGGTITTDGAYTVHTFTSNGTLVLGAV